MEIGSLGTALAVMISVVLVTGGAYAAVVEYRNAQQCHEKYDGMEGTYADCEDFRYALWVYGGSFVSIVGVVGLLIAGRHYLDDGEPATATTQ